MREIRYLLCTFEVMADRHSIHRLSLAGIVQIRLEKKKGGGGDEAVYSRLEREGDSRNFVLSERSGVTHSSIHVAKQQTYKRINGNGQIPGIQTMKIQSPVHDFAAGGEVHSLSFTSPSHSTN